MAEAVRRGEGGRRRAGALQRVFATLLIIGGLGLAVFGGLLCLSALNAEQAERFIRDWSTTGQEPSAEAFAIAEAAAIRSIRLHPGPSGRHWDRLGRVYDWAHWRAPFSRNPLPTTLIPPARILEQPLGTAGAENVQAARLRALSAHEQAVSLRPLWPYGVSRLAFARLRAGAADAELARLLREAYRLGPWRPSVNRRITEVGLRAWAGLDRATRDIVLENARRTARYSRADERRVRELGEATGRALMIETLVLP